MIVFEHKDAHDENSSGFKHSQMNLCELKSNGDEMKEKETGYALRVKLEMIYI